MSVSGTRITFDDAVTEALRLEMHRDPALVVFFGSTDGIASQLAGTFGPERVIESHAVGARWCSRRAEPPKRDCMPCASSGRPRPGPRPSIRSPSWPRSTRQTWTSPAR